MTTATRTAIVPAMPLLDVPARTDEDPRTVPTVPLAAPAQDRTVPTANPGPTPDRTAPTQDRTGTVPPEDRSAPGPTEERTALVPDPTEDRTGIVPTEDRTITGPTEEQSASDSDQDRNSTDPTASPKDRTGTDRSKAAAIREVFDAIYDPTTEQIHAWLDEHGVHATPRYVRRIVGEERARRKLSDTSEHPALSAEVLARLDAEHDEIDTRIDPAPAPAPKAPAESPALAEQATTVELAARVRDARARLPLQADPSLLTALSDEEIQAERELAEWERKTDRDIRRSRKRAELDNAKREQGTAAALAKASSRDARWHQRALSMRQRLTSPDARLTQLYRRAEWSSRALIGVMLLAMIWSGVNVQHNLVPDGNMHKMLYWLSYGLEATISVPLIIIMLAATTAARWGKELPRKKVVPIELLLLTLTVGLNAGPHLREGFHAAEYVIAPVMVGAVVWLHAWVSQHYAALIGDSGATSSAPEVPDK